MKILHRALEVAKTEGISTLLHKAWHYILLNFDQKTGILSIMSIPYATRKFKTIINWINALDFIFSDNLVATLLKPIQIREEIAQLLRILDGLKPKVVLEIGTAHGGTLFLLSRVAARDALLISIDLPGGLFGGGYPRLKSALFKRFALDKQRIELLRMDSHDPDTLEKVKQLIGDSGVDFLFIDGDHRYEGVKKDYEMYSPLVKPGGVIAFHDIVPGPKEYVGGVPQFWSELKRSLPPGRYIEIVKDWNQGGYGIGVVFK